MVPWTNPSPQRKRHLDVLSGFCTDDSRLSYTLPWDVPFPLKIAPCHGGSEPPSNTWSLGSIQVLNPNGISIGSAVFAGLTSVTERQTDRQTTLLGLANYRPHLRRIRSTAMRSNDYNKWKLLSDILQVF